MGNNTLPLCKEQLAQTINQQQHTMNCLVNESTWLTEQLTVAYMAPLSNGSNMLIVREFATYKVKTGKH